jgi:hypothetical protein
MFRISQQQAFRAPVVLHRNMKTPLQAATLLDIQGRTRAGEFAWHPR